MIHLLPDTNNLVSVGVARRDSPVRVVLESQACNGDGIDQPIELNACAVAGVVSFYLNTSSLQCGWYTLSVYLPDGHRLTRTDARIICPDPC